MCREKNFSAVQEHCPPEKNHSLFATRRSLFATRHSPIAVASARQEPRSPKISPTKVGAQILRHQLRTKVHSMVCFCFAITHSCHWL